MNAHAPFRPTHLLVREDGEPRYLLLMEHRPEHPEYAEWPIELWTEAEVMNNMARPVLVASIGLSTVTRNGGEPLSGHYRLRVILS